MLPKKELISTAIAYANAGPHIGHAFEFVLADTVTRLKKLSGDDVYFITGMDEHGQKIEGLAKERGVPVEEFVGKNAELFKELDQMLGVEYDFFVRTSDKERHHKGAQLMWQKLIEAGALERRSYKALYCVGCEEFKMEKDLNEQGECHAHLKKPEIVEEENWFFLLSRYTSQIKEEIMSGRLEIVPSTRKNEILALLDRGLDDVSFSRPKSKVSWGVPVPNDDSQVMYVWCDALSNYVTAIGFGSESFDMGRAQNMTHIIGKDILRFHAAIWPGMLLAARLPLPKRILVHGFITSGGQKMSKTLGNVISPNQMLEIFKPACGDLAGDALRFVLLHEIPTFEDGDLTIDSIRTAYTAYLANGIGNLTSRIMRMALNANVSVSIQENTHADSKDMEILDLKRALEVIVTSIASVDKRIQEEEPFKIIKVDEEKGRRIISELMESLVNVAYSLRAFLPKTSATILECVRKNKMPETPLFGRLV